MCVCVGASVCVSKLHSNYQTPITLDSTKQISQVPHLIQSEMEPSNGTITDLQTCIEKIKSSHVENHARKSNITLFPD